MKNIAKNSKLLIILIITILLYFFYISFKPIFSPDSGEYYSNFLILKNIIPLENWNTVRGPGFSIVIYIITLFFGESILGITLGLFVLNLLMLFFGYLFLKKIIVEENLKKYEKNIWLLYIILVVFNPLIIGYSHTVLTESVIPMIVMIVLYNTYKWMSINFIENKLLYIVYTLFFAFTCAFVWQVKQPYLPIILFIIIFMSLFSIIINKKKLENLLQRLATLIICISFVTASIILWNTFLIRNNVPIKQDKTNSSFLASGLLNGIQGNIMKNKTFECKESFIRNYSRISKKEKQKMLDIYREDKDCEKFIIFDVFNTKNKFTGQMVLFKDNNDLSISDSLKFVIKSLFKNPISVLDSYFKNYMATIDLFPTYINFPNYTTEKVLVNINRENGSLGLGIYENRPIYWWGYGSEETQKSYKENNEYLKYMVQYEVWNTPNNIPAMTAKIISPIYLVAFKILFFSAPIIAIYSFIQFFRYKYNQIYLLQTVLFGTAFLHTLFHAVTGAIIDRYAYIAFPLTLIGFILLFVKKEPKEKNNLLEGCISEVKKDSKIKVDPSLKDKKILFVIPAYNESANIEKVLKEIKTEISYADILVINDCSTDNTKQIVEKNNVKCITNIFNMKYAMAVQTGIKYAYENDYDFVIQYDADGQHIAKEVNKLFKKYQETSCNIVIGSRFLENTGYPHPFFRKIGTKLFTWLIKAFCHKTITDPTSGFQLLDRKVIKRYAKMGYYPEYPDANLIIEMLYAGYDIEECSVEMRIRETGESMHGGIIKPIKYMIKIFYTIIIIIIVNIKRRVDTK